MKIAILGDLHFGKRKNIDDVMFNYFKKDFFPYLKEKNINFIFQLGDLIDNRRNINVLSGKVVTDYFTLLQQYLFQYYQIVGNHDFYYMNSKDVTSLDIFSQNLNMNCEIIKKPFNVLTSCGLVSWGEEKENYLKTKYLFGHFETVGFEMMKGVECRKGNQIEDFNGYEKVFSGHFHRKDERENIIYVGSLFDLDFGEYDVDHGFYIFDNETGEYEFVKNENRIHYKVIYKEEYINENKVFDIKDGELIDVNKLKNKIVKLVVKEDVSVGDKKVKYLNFLKELESQNLEELKIVELDIEKPKIEMLSEIDDDVEIFKIINDYIDGMKFNKNKENNLKQMVGIIYEKVLENDKI